MLAGLRLLILAKLYSRKIYTHYSEKPLGAL
jgi:hypothetical protein